VFPPCPTPSAEAAAEMYAPLLEAATRWVLNPPPIFDEKMEGNYVQLGITLKPDFPREVLQADLADLFTWQERGEQFVQSNTPGYLGRFMGATSEKHLRRLH
jgi:hypothetical protein